MTKEFVPYKQALALKELGFDEPCYDAYTFTGGGESTVPPEKYNHRQDAVAAPLYQQAFRWFREKYNMYHIIMPADLGKYEDGNPNFQSAIYSRNPVSITTMNNCDIYEEAELECLKKLIQIVNEKSV